MTFNFEKAKYEARKKGRKQKITVNDLEGLEGLKVGSKTDLNKLTFFGGI